MRSSRTIIALLALLAAAASVHASGCSVDCHDNLTCGAPPAATGSDGHGRERRRGRIDALVRA
jgi:hypothetical protein